MDRRTFNIGLASAATALMSAQLTCPSKAANYPDRSVKVIVPFGPTSLSDTLGRLWAARISQRLGQQFYVENQAGGGSNLGMGNAARSKPDGYTLLIGASVMAINPSLYNKVPYDVFNDFVPITMLGAASTVLVVNNDFPAKTFEEFAKLIAAKPSTFGFGCPGLGTPPQMQGELLKLKLKLDMVSVPFNGNGAMLQNVMGGHVPIGFGTITAVPQLVATGQLRALAISGTRRSPQLPQVPTFEELGLSDFDSGTFTGIFGRAGTDKDILDRLYAETSEFLALPETSSRFAEFGIETAKLTPDEFKQRLVKELELWGSVAKSAGMEKR